MRGWCVVLMAVLSAPASAAAAGTLSGRVTDPLGAGVHPVDIDVFQTSTGTLVNTPDDTTIAMGYYSIQFPTGQYNVTFKPFAGSHLFKRSFTGVNVGLGTTTLNAALLRGQYVSGRVTNTGGQGISLVALGFQSPTTGSAPSNVQDHLTDSGGNFTTLVDAGVWNASLIAPTSARLVPRLFPGVNLNTDQSLGTVVLEPGHLVQGTVTDNGFFPIADADIDVRPAGARTKLFTPQDNTDGGGHYTLMLPSGTFDISAGPPPG